tara:strand:- start:201 stop:536 length:336 start_codon:yes stop_codon:yes gene_type:complete
MVIPKVKENISVMYWREPPLEKGDNIVKDLGITCKKVFKQHPDGCPYCGGNDIIGIEVYGSGLNSPLFWSCEECEGLLLKYTINTTKKRLLKATKVFTVPSDWEVKKENFN